MAGDIRSGALLSECNSVRKQSGNLQNRRSQIKKQVEKNIISRNNDKLIINRPTVPSFTQYTQPSMGLKDSEKMMPCQSDCNNIPSEDCTITANDLVKTVSAINSRRIVRDNFQNF